MPTFSQEHRTIGIETPLGTDKLVLISFTGEEQISSLFRFELRLLSQEERIAPLDIVGKAIDFYVRFPDDEKRYFNGVVNRFTYAGQDDRTHYYSAEIVPWMWFLTKGSDCRVHETQKSKNAKDIIDGLLSELGFTDYEWDVKRNPEVREYCVQFRETHYEFITRLLAEEGIYYYFRHEQGCHKLVFTDHANGGYDCKDASVQLLSNLSQPEVTDNLTDWHHQYEFTSGKYSLTDYNFETPSTSLLLNKNSLISLKDNSKLEFYDFPGFFGQKGLGEALTKLRMEEEEAGYDTVRGGSECRSFSPGGRFKVEEHHNPGEKGGKWMLTSVRHTAALGGNYLTGASHSDEIYRNEFTCMPAEVTYRPPFISRTGVDGLQSAVVVGPAGEEIYTDKYGRIKVQFPWDRRGKKDDNSSFWIRVSQVHAGQGWGMMDLPRIGEEVLISFLDGNPDRPIVIGRVYNADNAVPFALPGEKTRRGNSTKTHKGAGYNEMSMDDTVGKEQLRVNAQYDMNSNVNHDQTLDVGNNQTQTVGVDRSRTVGSNETISVGSNRSMTVGSNHDETIATNQTVKVGANQSVTVGANQTTAVGGSQSVTVGKSKTETIAMASNEMVGVAKALEVGTAYSIVAGTNMSATVGGNSSATIAKNSSEDVGKKKTVTVADEISIVCGSSKLVMKKDGSILLEGKDIVIKGSGKITVKASGDMVLKGSKIGQN